jgi:para-nitrobenzyl esterase
VKKARVTVADGILEGSADKGVRRFFSVPYTAPLTDERRFREPQPVERWSGVRDATQCGPSAPQNRGSIPGVDMTALVAASSQTGPEYLTLNIFAPDGDVRDRPVMVFVHGGSFVFGSKDAAVYDGGNFARDGVVCVTVNYRLGIEGFLPIPGVPTIEPALSTSRQYRQLPFCRDPRCHFGGARWCTSPRIPAAT